MTLGVIGVVAVIAIVVAIVETRDRSKNPERSATMNDRAPFAEQHTTADDVKCTLTNLKCDQFPTQDRTGRKLHELVFSARTAGRNEEAICLAQQNVTSTDGWLAGASHFEASNAWEALGCHELAVREIEAALQRPRDRSWKDTCDLCSQLHANCLRCTQPHEITEDDLVGKWTGKVETNMRIPHDYSTGREASIDASTATETFEITRQGDQLINKAPSPIGLAGEEARAMKLTREQGVLVDRSQEDSWVFRYSLQGDQLKVETEIKGHFGGDAVGIFKRVFP